MAANRQIKMVKKTNNLTVSEALELFIRKCRVKNLSQKTISDYKELIGKFARFLGADYSVDEITRDTIDDYILYLRDKGTMNDISIATNLRHVRAFCYYLGECDYIQPFKIIIPKVEKKIKETYTDEELTRLLKKPNVGYCDFTEFKIWAFENFLLATGCRISTALTVKINEIDFENGVISLCKLKNRKQQVIPLSQTLAEVLREYLDYRGGEPEDVLFCNNYGKPSATRTYQTLVKNYNISRNVNKTSCHTFRHTFAKNWIIAGGDQFRLMKILGHSDLSTTKEYVQMFGQDLQIDFEKFNPLDQISKKTSHIKMK